MFSQVLLFSVFGVVCLLFSVSVLAAAGSEDPQEIAGRFDSDARLRSEGPS